ncbi:MAG: hypothetical protein CME17_09400 [Gemmatimonadetes bacterium]|nr:hypothetical protein [Gemmatimonadota bacterium]
MSMLSTIIAEIEDHSEDNLITEDQIADETTRTMANKVCVAARFAGKVQSEVDRVAHGSVTAMCREACKAGFTKDAVRNWVKEYEPEAYTRSFQVRLCEVYKAAEKAAAAAAEAAEAAEASEESGEETPAPTTDEQAVTNVTQQLEAQSTGRPVENADAVVTEAARLIEKYGLEEAAKIAGSVGRKLREQLEALKNS